jgi:beta-mannosidase
VIREQTLPSGEFDVMWTGLPVDLWNPNMHGDQPLYDLTCSLLDADGNELDSTARRVGFRHVEWRQCEGAPAGADPWLCVVNGKPIFLQGVNWNPVRTVFADVTEPEYRKRLELYRDLGCNMLRVWAGSFLENEVFYDLCDEFGLMVWQEFPLSSSGVENWPPEDEKSIAEQSEIALSYIERKQHHVSLIIWCGGNELLGALDGGKVGAEKPVDLAHPMLARFNEIVKREDPTRRFLPTSASGPRFCAQAKDFGKGLHWDVHGPWKHDGDLDSWADYWSKDDALFRSETGSPGAGPAEITRRYAGDLDPMPGTADNPLWSRHTNWWVEWPRFVVEHGREPRDLEEYVAWSQARQAKALSIAVKACKDRFPRCGGVLLWTGHDCFPCETNTSIVDFDGNPKPAALALKKIWRGL